MTFRQLLPFRLFLVGLLLWGADLPAGEPAMFRGDAAHGGVYAGAAPTLKTLVWRFRTGAKVLSSPAVAEGTVYLGGMDHLLYALDARKGEPRWTFRAGGLNASSPAVTQGRVFFSSLDGLVHALDSATGKPIWTFRTEGERRFTVPGIHGAMPRTEVMADPFDVFLSSPVVAGNTLYLGSGDQHIYALDAATGALRWKHDNHKGWVIASPAVQGGRVYFPTSDGQRFKALAAASGKLLFDRPLKAVSFSSPAIAGNRLLLGTSDGWLHLLELETGAQVADFQTEGCRQNGPRYLDAQGQMINSALYPDGTLDGMIIGLDRMFSLGSILSSPVVAEGMVYVGSTDGNVYALR